MKSILHHIDLTVADIERSFPLYDLFLGHAGFEPTGRGDEIASWKLHGSPCPYLTLLKASGPNAGRRHDRYSTGLHHLALAARSRADVDDLHAKLVVFGADILDPPRDYPEYGEGYYALFVADPDGIKLEYCWTAPEGT